jgi:hypothetical protein
VVVMGMIIRRSLTPLNYSRTLRPTVDVRRSAAVTTTRAGRCRMFVETAPAKINGDEFWRGSRSNDVVDRVE